MVNCKWNRPKSECQQTIKRIIGRVVGDQGVNENILTSHEFQKEKGA